MYRIILTFAMLVSFVAQALETNIWQGNDGGDWDNKDNWSLGRVPGENDRAQFPDFDGGNYTVNITGEHSAGGIFVDYRKVAGKCPTVTFAGGGKLTLTGVMENYIRENRRLVLDGMTLELTGHYLMVYGLLDVKAGAVFKNSKITRLWRGTPSITVERGGLVLCEGLIDNFLTATINVNGGEFICSEIKKGTASDSGTSVNPINVTISDGGTFSVAKAEFGNNPTLSMSDGFFKVGTSATFPEEAQINFTGGTLELPVPNPPMYLVEHKGLATIRYVFGSATTSDSTILENLQGETLVVDSSSDFALNLWPHNTFLDKEFFVTGMLVLTNGCINFNRKGAIYSDYPVFIKAFRIGDTDTTKQTYGTPTIGFPEIVVGKDYPFVTMDQNHLYYKFYIEGPTTIRASADMDEPKDGEETLLLSGDLTVDTSDYYDESVKRKMYLYNLCAKDCASLTVTGGGELNFSQAHSGSPFTRVVVGENTTLTLGSLVSTVDYGPLHTDELELKAGAILNIPAGSNSIHAAVWKVDPTARINVIFVEGLSVDAKGLMYDSSARHSVSESQIALCGATDNWGLASGDGAWIVTNALANLEPVNVEWTGNGADNKIVTPENWHNVTKALDDYSYLFGAGYGKPEMSFCNVYADLAAETAAASTVKSFQFRNTATKSFKLSGNQVTLNNTGDYSSSGVFSESAVPHYIENSLRVLALHSLCAAAEGPLFFNPKSTFVTKFNDAEHAANLKMSLVGDIRFGKTIKGCKVAFATRNNAYASRSVGSRLTVLPGGNVTFTNQTVKQTVPYTGFRVDEGGILAFENGSPNANFSWTAASARHTVNGTMNVDIPLYGGNDQSFAGSGSLKLASLVPSSYESVLSFGEKLTVSLPPKWSTITASATNGSLTLRVYGAPTICTEGDWDYGVFEDIETPVIAGKRAAEITSKATLTLNPNAGIATFSDPVSGKGTIAITNGTLRMTGGVSPSIGVEVRNGGTYEWSAAHELRSLECAPGSKLLFAAPITVKERVSLDNIDLEWVKGASPERTKVWTTLFVSKTGFDGDIASFTKLYYTRTVQTENGFEYQIRPKIGTVLTFR